MDTLTLGNSSGERREVVVMWHNLNRFVTWFDSKRDLDLYPSAWRRLGWEVVA